MGEDQGRNIEGVQFPSFEDKGRREEGVVLLAGFEEFLPPFENNEYCTYKVQKLMQRKASYMNDSEKSIYILSYFDIALMINSFLSITLLSYISLYIHIIFPINNAIFSRISVQ